ncbi:MAG: hypothetical protein QOG97_3546 [Acidimicrobiaceae bacterium]|nr:hypothetical protein [Acidimicrobiaceae bacterium]
MLASLLELGNADDCHPRFEAAELVGDREPGSVSQGLYQG